ncbi:MAG: hypothetical protein JW928_08815 [Candidatus Aureabacteria bacterium]|nr:hypothetical protein [Candidatus Auribacterota bacterium]
MKRKKIAYFFSLGVLIVFCSLTARAGDKPFPPVTVRDGKIYAGDEELFLKAVAYAGLRPGKDHTDPFTYKDYGYRLIEMDMKRIREAGFNAVRTWSLTDEKIIEIAAQHGLWVVGGIWTPQRLDVNSSHFVKDNTQLVAEQAKIYSKYHNIAMLLILNEPEPGFLRDQDKNKIKDYLDKIIQAAKKECKGVPVSFSNWPNAAVVDSQPWDVISYNIYASTTTKFQRSLGYRGYVEGIKKMKSCDKPFFISECTYYAPLPGRDPRDLTAFTYVKSEKEQSEKTLQDIDVLVQTGISGFTVMQWLDNWSVSSLYPFLKPVLKEPARNKFIHDNVAVEWGGLLSLDNDVKGNPRQVYFDLKKANQALLLKPDSKDIYDNELPVSLYIEDTVGYVALFIDGSKTGDMERTSPHWIKQDVPVKHEGTKPERHTLEVYIYDTKGELINTLQRDFFTGSKRTLPQVSISASLDKMGWPTFLIRVAYPDGRPVPDAEVTWGALNALTWEEAEGTVVTDNKGEVSFVSPLYGEILLAGAGYHYRNGDFEKNCSDLLYLFQ